MADETTGHEVDLDSMDSGAFHDALNAKIGEGDTSESSETTAESKSTGDADERQAAPEPKESGEMEPKPFRLSLPAQAQDGDTGQKEDGQEDMVALIHRGQEVRVTRKKAQELMQKGYDYDFKVGRHGKVAQLLDQDREAAALLDSYFKAKSEGRPFRYGGDDAKSTQEPQRRDPSFRPRIKPLAEYDTEEAWFEANLSENLPAIAEMLRQSMPVPQAPQRAVDPTIMRLMARDPDDFQVVGAAMQKAAMEHLSVAQLAEVDRNPEAFVQFYDWVKNNIVKPKQTPPPGTSQPTPRPGFRARSGGGALEREGSRDTGQKVWDMPQKDFRAFMDKIKAGETA